MVRKTNTKAPKRKVKVRKDKEPSLVFNCTSCAQPQLLVQGKRNILCHPQLQVGVCRECLIFAHSEYVPLDEEGYEIYCRWCSELGNLVCCDECKAPFCEMCISRNIGSEYYDSLMDIEDWKCFICQPDCLESLRELTKAALDHQNYKEPSELLLSKCSAIFEGDADVNDSDREEIVKERLRLRRNAMNESLSWQKKGEKKGKQEKVKEEDEEPSSDEYGSEESAESDEETKKVKAKEPNSEYESSPESPIKESPTQSPAKESDDESLPSVKVSNKKEESGSDSDTKFNVKERGDRNKRKTAIQDVSESSSDEELLVEKRKQSKSYKLSLKRKPRKTAKKPKYASSSSASEQSSSEKEESDSPEL